MKKYIILLVFILSLYKAKAEHKIEIKCIKNIYTIDTANNSFNKTTTTRAEYNSNSYIHSIYLGELDNLNSVNAYTLDAKGKKSKLSKSSYFNSKVLTNNFYAGINSHNIQFENKDYLKSKESILIESTILSKEIIRLASIDFIKSSIQKIDTIIHEVEVPYGFVLHFSTADAKLVRNLKIDSTNINGKTIYIFKKIFSENEKIDSSSSESIRSIICSKNVLPYRYLNQWYINIIASEKLSDKYKNICDSITKNMTDNDLIIKTIYNYVKNNIRYIDIENGINAFKPRACDVVLYNKFGDCKDMAYLIERMLIHKGIKSNLALSSTINHEFQFNFPSIASANHLICIAENNNKTYYLDATEKYGIYKLPSIQTLNTYIFIIDNDQPSIKLIPLNDAKKSKVIRQYDLKVNQNDISGTASVICYGYSKIELESIISYSSKSQLNKTLESYFNQKGYNTKYEDFKIKNTDSTIEILCKVSLKNNVISEVLGKSYINLNFLPNPTPYIALPDTLVREIDLNFNQLYQMNFNLSFNKNINEVNSLFKSFQFEDNIIAYQFNINKKTNTLNINYDVVNKINKIEKSEFKKYKNNSIKIATTLNHEITLN